MKAEPKVQKFMTSQPYSIEADRAVSEAQKIMADARIRHLPVTRNSKVSGMLSERDIKAALGIAGTSPDSLLVGDICSEPAYVVSPEASLRDVSIEMAEHHYGSAVVAQNGKLVGILTTVDICRALAEVLEQRYHA